MNVIYENGWYELETDGIYNFRWSSPNSKIKIDTQLISKFISLQIGSPLENKLTVKTSKYQRDLYIKVGWHDYTIEFDDCIEFFSKPMDLQDDRKLSFMLGNLNLSYCNYVNFSPTSAQLLVYSSQAYRLSSLGYGTGASH